MEFLDILKKQGCQSEVIMIIDGVQYSGWVSAKPINPRWFRTRLRDALMVFRGKAIAVQYFDDLTEQQKQDYIKTQTKS